MAGNNGAIKLVAGNSNPALAEAIGGYLGTPLTKAIVRRFADMEIFVEIQENVRGADVFILQSTSYPANDHLMELLIIIDALRRASARRITAVIPYFGYARQDRKVGPRTPISAKLVANLITRAGADRVMTLDLHAGQIQGFFDIPTDNLFAAPVMMRDIRQRFDLTKADRGVARRRRRRARARACQAHQRAARHRRQTPRAAGRIRSDERHRRGRRRHLHPGRRHRQLRRHAGERRRRACSRKAPPRSTAISPTACSPAAPSPASAIQSQGIGDHRFDPADPSRRRVEQYPRAADCDADRRSHQPHRGRRIRSRACSTEAAFRPRHPPSQLVAGRSVDGPGRHIVRQGQITS